MRLLVSRFLLGVAFSLAASARPPALTFHVQGDDPGSWPRIFHSIGLMPASRSQADVLVLDASPASTAAQWLERAEQGAFVIVEGDSEIARAWGFRPGRKTVAVRSVLDARRPKLSIIWERAEILPVFEMPPQAQVFARERWEGAPLVAGFRRGAGGVLWVIASPGRRGYERFPYLLQALADLGLEPPLRSAGLWAFFDSSYRSRVDPDYFAARWRRSGIGALHVAAWHFWEPDAERDAYLARLIEACHRRAILVYAWLELPHVSEKFWRDHPQWREQTALLQDAHLDWRKLLNLANPDCARAVETGLSGLVERFDWDGVNLAELYFESLEGHANPSRFTPMNQDVRREFAEKQGFDPIELFDAASPRHHRGNPDGLRLFLDYRAGLARRLQTTWLGRIEEVRRQRPHLDLVLTHVDDRFDTRMRDLIGADAAGLLPLLERHDFTFLIEDPATVWHLGPERYTQIAARYEPLTRRTDKLAVDINIVERYQDVYPTKQQTGVELFQLVHLAAKAFPRVALYFENSILTPDLPLLASAAAVTSRIERLPDGGVAVESPRGVGIPWNGAARVDGRPWPVTDGATVWLPAGAHMVQSGGQIPAVRLLDFSGELRSAASRPSGLEFSYRSSSRAWAVLNRRPVRVEIDGGEVPVTVGNSSDVWVLALPRGQHLVAIAANSEF